MGSYWQWLTHMHAHVHIRMRTQPQILRLPVPTCVLLCDLMQQQKAIPLIKAASHDQMNHTQNIIFIHYSM